MELLARPSFCAQSGKCRIGWGLAAAIGLLWPRVPSYMQRVFM
jgi:hypothetical protein